MRKFLNRWSIASLILLSLLAVACGGAATEEEPTPTIGATGGTTDGATGETTGTEPTPTTVREVAPPSGLAGSADKLLREPLAKALGVSLRLSGNFQVTSGADTSVTLAYQMSADPSASLDLAGAVQKALESLGAKVSYSVGMPEGAQVAFEGLAVGGRTAATGFVTVGLSDRSLVVMLVFQA